MVSRRHTVEICPLLAPPPPAGTCHTRTAKSPGRWATPASQGRLCAARGLGGGAYHAGRQPVDEWAPSRGAPSPRLRHQKGAGPRRPGLGTSRPPPRTMQGTPRDKSHLSASAPQLRDGETSTSQCAPEGCARRWNVTRGRKLPLPAKGAPNWQKLERGGCSTWAAGVGFSKCSPQATETVYFMLPSTVRVACH